MIATRPATALLFLILSLTGCSNLKEVRDFAAESAKFSAYTELTTRFRDTYQREQPYLFGTAEELAQNNDKRRRAAYEDLLKINRSVSLYMQTLATLAGEDTFDLSKEIGSLGAGIKEYPELGIKKKHVDAYSDIAKVVGKWITSSYQQRAVREMIKEGDAPLQTVLEGMSALVRCYRETNENERKTVLGFFEVEIPYADAPKDRLLAALARAHAQSKESEYRIARRKYTEAEKGIRNVAEGHGKLFENIDKLSAAETRTLIKKFAEDIKTIRDNLQALGS